MNFYKCRRRNSNHAHDPVELQTVKKRKESVPSIKCKRERQIVENQKTCCDTYYTIIRGSKMI